jgi:hypothetical protein
VDAACQTYSEWRRQVGNGADWNATERPTDIAAMRKGVHPMMDSNTMKYLVEYQQAELARTRGQRNWRTLFKRS